MSASQILTHLSPVLPTIESVYKDMHAHPELSMEETTGLDYQSTVKGARAMIDDGLFSRVPKPDVILGQHVMVGPEGKVHELPVNHNPKFAPVLHPTLSTGVEAMVVATLAWNAKNG